MTVSSSFLITWGKHFFTLVSMSFRFGNPLSVFSPNQIIFCSTRIISLLLTWFSELIQGNPFCLKILSHYHNLPVASPTATEEINHTAPLKLPAILHTASRRADILTARKGILKLLLTLTNLIRIHYVFKFLNIVFPSDNLHYFSLSSILFCSSIIV